MATKNKNNVPRRALSLDDFQAETFTAVIEVGDEAWEIPCRELTYVEFSAVSSEVQHPQPPEMAGPTGKVFITNDPDYLRKKAEVEQEIARRRVARMMHYPGKSDADKLAALERAPMALYLGLVSVLNQKHLAQDARIEAASHSFRASGSSNGTHSEAHGVDAGAVVEPVA